MSLRIAAVGDVHCGKTSQGELRPLFMQAADNADVLLLLGDLTNYGLPEEIEVLLEELKPISRMRVLAVLGNHDHESGRQDEAVKLLTQGGVTVLDGESVEIGEVGFAGVKGFVGGFGRRSLTAWGEASLKALVQESIDEAVKLESALSRLRTPYRVVMLHYAPIQATIEGEPLEIAPFLGSSRLEEAIDRYRATVAFHGHAHYGSLEGRTKAGIPVFNVALPLLKRVRPDLPPLYFWDTEMAETPTAASR